MAEGIRALTGADVAVSSPASQALAAERRRSPLAPCHCCSGSRATGVRSYVLVRRRTHDDPDPGDAGRHGSGAPHDLGVRTTVRLFVAAELSDAMRACGRRSEATICGAVSARRVTARWLPAESLHITVRFIGDVPTTRRPSSSARSVAPLRLSPFEIRLGDCGIFPPSGPPRVIWMALAEGSSRARGLNGEMDARLAPLGFEPERRPYAAHLTMARVKDVARGSQADVRRIILESASPNAAGRVAHVDDLPQPPLLQGRPLRVAGQLSLPVSLNGRWPPGSCSVTSIGSVPFAFLLARRAGIDVRVVGERQRRRRQRDADDRYGARRGGDGARRRERRGGGLVTQATRSGGGHGRAGAAAVVGHIYPVWLRFHGGKGVAVAAGVFSVLAPFATRLAGGVRVDGLADAVVSLGSIAATSRCRRSRGCRVRRPEVAVAAVGSGALILFRIAPTSAACARDRTADVVSARG